MPRNQSAVAEPKARSARARRRPSPRTAALKPRIENGPDRIEERSVVKASRKLVWHAIARADEFGAWFGASLQSEFRVGRRIVGRITQPGFEHLRMELTVERMEPETFFSYRWHPYAVDPRTNYSSEPTTLVEFRLEDVKEGTRVTIAESGFDRIPRRRRDEARRMNAKGWAEQVRNLKRHVSG